MMRYFAQRPLLCTLILAAVFQVRLPAAPVDDLEKDGRAASNALRDLQKLELVEFKSQARWPTSEQHQHITTQLAEASDGIARSLVLGLDPPHPQVVSMMRAALKAVTTLGPWVTPADDQPRAPAPVVKALAKLQVSYTKLLTHFPPVRVSDERLSR